MPSKIIVFLLAFLAIWSPAAAAPLPPNTSENPAAVLKRATPGMWRLECTTRPDGSRAMSAYDCFRRYGTYCDEYGHMWMQATLTASYQTGDCSRIYRNCYCDQHDPPSICIYSQLAIGRCNVVNNTFAGNYSLNPNIAITKDSPLGPQAPNTTLAPNATLTPSATLALNTSSSAPNSSVVPPVSAGDSLGIQSSVLVTILLAAVAFGYVI